MELITGKERLKSLNHTYRSRLILPWQIWSSSVSYGVDIARDGQKD